MGLRLILVRHGETAWNREGRYQGQSDIPLNPEGLRQAELLRERFRSQRIDVIYSSDLERSRQTATVIARGLGLEVNLDPALREMDFGEWEGLTFKEIADAYSGTFRAWLEDPANVAPPGGEKLEGFAARVIRAVGRLKETHFRRDACDGVGVLVVTHGGPIRVIIAHVLGLGLRRIWDFSLDHGGISVVDLLEDGGVVRSLNDTCHLFSGVQEV